MAHSFVSAMNYWGKDYVACHLLRASRESGKVELLCDLLTGEASPTALLAPQVRGALEGYRKDFGRFVTSGGAALDMVKTAAMRISIQHGTLVGYEPHARLHGRLTGEIVITDDRGKQHVGTHV